MPQNKITRSQLASGQAPIAYRSGDVEKDSINVEDRTVTISFSSEYPVERWDWVEVLGHGEGEVDLSRFDDSAPFLSDHNWSDQRGVIQKAWIENGRGYATVKMSRNPLGEQLFIDMQDGICRNISVGYRIVEAEMVRRENNVEHWRITRWLPLEISNVSVPADPTIGLGRSDTGDSLPVKIRGCQMPSEETNPETQTPAASQERADDSTPQKPHVRSTSSEPEPVNHAQRIAEAGEQYGHVDLANEFIRNGETFERFNKALMDKLHEKRNDSASQSTAFDLDLEEKDLRRYSLIQAIRGAASGKWKKAGLERAVSDAIAQRAGKDPEGVYISYEALGYGLQRQMQGQKMQRLQSAGADGLGAELVGTELHSEMFIEVLRTKAVVGGLGARMMSGLVGELDIPKMTGTAAFYWVDEDGAPQDSDISTGIVAMRPKTIAAAVPITRRLMIQSTPDIEALVRDDILTGLGLGVDNALLAGSGIGAEPLGIRNTTGIGAVDITAGATWAKIVELETDVAEAEASATTSAYLMRPTMRGKLKTTEKAANTAQFIWADNNVNGYKAEVTTQMQPNEILFGDFSQSMVGLWGALDIVPDRSTKAASGGLVMRLFQDADVALRHATAFSLAS